MRTDRANGREPRLLHGEAPHPDERRLLLITYHFPPSREVGALRWRRFARFAVDRGWALDVFTLDPDHLAGADPDSLEELPAAVRVWGVREAMLPFERLRQHLRSFGRRTPTPGRDAGAGRRPDSLRNGELRSPLAGLRNALRAVNAWRDYARGDAWGRAVETAVQRVSRDVRYDAVVTCGPPHMVHTAGQRIAAARGAPFVMDMRDPWSLLTRISESVASPVWRAFAQRREREAVAAAALVVANTEPSRAAMQNRYPAARDRVVAVWNGYDEEPPIPSQRGSSFVIGFAGTIYLDRDPRPLFRAAGRVIREFGLEPDQFRLEFMGEVAAFDGVALDTMATEEGIGGFVRVLPAGTRAEAMRFMAGASMLVSLTRDTDTAIPWKVFEYARFDAWLLALAPHGSATELVLQGSGADVISPHDVDAIAAVLRVRYAAHRRGERPTRPHLGETFSRRTQAHRFFDELERRIPSRRELHDSPV